MQLNNRLWRNALATAQTVAAISCASVGPATNPASGQTRVGSETRQISATEGDSATGVKVASAANNAFGLQLYGRLKEKGNLALSPASLVMSLSTVYLGAAGETEREIATTLKLESADRAAVEKGFELFATRELATKTRSEAVQLSLANCLWVRPDRSIRPGFEQIVKNLGGQLKKADFNQDTARQTVNRWVAETTHGKIQQLFSAEDLSDQTEFVLGSALYFRGLWAAPFLAQNTKSLPFHRANGSADAVATMHQVTKLPYAHTNRCQILKMPYGESNQPNGPTPFSMVLILPSDPRAADLPSDFVSEYLKVGAELKPTKVSSFIPKFKIECRLPLSKTLAAMGMKQAFTDRADFSGIVDKPPPVRLQQLVHQAFVSVDERGTEAAAATGTQFYPAGASLGKPVEFRADHPFLFLIEVRHGEDTTILFLGRVIDPKE
jgi:serpin B